MTSISAHSDWNAVGTLLYSSPEQAGILKRPVDGRSDLYSLGAVLFEATTGAPPLRSPNIEELAHQHAAIVPPDVRSLRPTVSRGLAAIIAKLLAKDPKALEGASLSENVVQVIIERLSHFAVGVKEVLVAAALLRVPLRASVLAAICGVDVAKISNALTKAVAERILKRAPGDQYMFVHDRLRDALLSTLAPEKTRQLHCHTARVLDSLEAVDPILTYTHADHYYSGRPEQEPARAYEANVAAGRQAAQERAFDQAQVFYHQATDIAERHGIKTDADFEQALAEACLRTGRMDEAAIHCNKALTMAKQRGQRARLRLMRARIHLGQLDIPATHTELELAFAELGEKFHRPSVYRLMASGVSLLLTFPAKKPDCLATGTQKKIARFIAS